MGTTAKELYIIGAGGFGREVADTVREINRTASADSSDVRLAVGASSGEGTSGGAGADGDDEGVGAVEISDLNQTHDPFVSGPVHRIAGFVDDDESL